MLYISVIPSLRYAQFEMARFVVALDEMLSQM